MITDRADERTLELILIDDAEADLEALRRSVTKLPMVGGQAPTVRTFTDPAEALAQLPARGPAVIVCDYNMPGSSGLEWLPDFVRANVGPIIILTGQGDEEIATEAFRKGASDYLVKSTVLDNPQLLALAVRESLRRYRLEQRNSELSRELKIANRELKRKNARLTDLTETAHRFVDNVAHEFRTPLTVVREFASIMADGIGGPISDEQRQYLDFIGDATRDLSGLIDDFLDSSKLKAGSLCVDRRARQVETILDHARTLLECRAASKRISIVQEIEHDVPEIFADGEKIGRVLVNLVVNAVKFSPPQSAVRISVSRPAPGDVEIAVSDQGRGMSEEELATVFERFRQIGDRDDAMGFGLGLSIVRELVWLNLGAVRVTSRPGAGSTFAFTVPVWDHQALPARYLGWLEQRQPDGVVSALRAVASDDDLDAEALRATIASVTYPTDLVLPAADESSVLLLGASGEPVEWLTRIRVAAQSRLEPAQRAFHLETLGTWPCRQATRAVSALLATAARELPRCA